MPKICTKRTKTGKRCKAHALASSDFCFFHDPESAEVRELGRRMGGLSTRAGRTEAPFPECNITTDAGLIEFMQALMNDTWKLGRSVGRSRALCHMADLLSDLVQARDTAINDAGAVLRREERGKMRHERIMSRLKVPRTEGDEESEDDLENL